MNPYKAILSLLLFSTFSSLALGENQTDLPITGKQTLQNMVNAMQTLNYQGTVTFLRNGKLEPMKYFHAAHDGLEQERLLSLNSPLREIIRDTGKVSCLYKETKQKIEEKRPFDRSFLIDLPKDINNLDSTYTAKLVGEEDIAMLPSFIINIEPNDKFRYPRTLWVEKQHFLPLKAVVYDLNNDVLEQLLFTELTIKDSLPFVDSKSSTPPLGNLSAQSLTEAKFLLSLVPLGFKELFFTSKPMHNSSQPVDHLLLSDGIAWISVYMESKPTTSHNGLLEPKTVQAIGAINFYSRAVENYEFTVMGDVPPETVKLIAENIQLRDSQH